MIEAVAHGSEGAVRYYK